MTTRRWWNGRWGRLTRRDVFMRVTDGDWVVELRRGGEGGRTRTRSFGSEEAAVSWVEDALVAAEAGWRELDARWLRKVASSAATAS